MATFKSSEDFLNTMKSLKNVKLGYVKSLLVSKGCVNSYFASYSDIIDSKILNNNTPDKLGTVKRSVKSSTNLVSDDDTDPLILDPYLATILNEKREVNIEGITYRIEKSGTYIYPENMEQYVDELVSSPNYNQVQVGENIFKIDENVYRYENTIVDDVISNEEVNPEPSTPVNTTLPSFEGYVSTGVNELAENFYDNMDTYNFDSHTWLGGIIQNIFGRTKAHFAYFDNKHRLKVNFYDVDFGFYTSTGINVKMQTKGWTGIWRQLTSEQLRLGWDGLDYDLKFNNMPTPPMQTDLTFENASLGNSLSFLTKVCNISGTTLGNYVDLQKSVNNVTNSLYKDALKTIWKEVKKIAPSQWDITDNYIKSFRIFYPEKIQFISGRFEKTEYNTSEITEVFDIAVGIKAIFSSGSGGINVSSISGAAPTSITINKASIYGMGKYNSDWKGVRIDKRN